jgi:hypothetical protein
MRRNPAWTAVLMIVGWWVGWCAGQAVPASASGSPEAIRQSFRQQFPPKKIKPHGPHRILRFEDIDRRLAEATAWLEQNRLEMAAGETAEDGKVVFRFEDLFQPSRSDVLFPLSNNVLRLVPEASLAGLVVFDGTGTVLGTFSNKYPFTRQGERSFTLYFFQYQTSSGALRRTGPDLLLDRFSVRWQDVADKPCLVLSPPGCP